MSGTAAERLIDVPPDWDLAVRRMLEGPARRVVVLGPADAGKSSFCRLTLARAAATRCPVTLLDADLAQKTIGPPACVTLGVTGPQGMPIPAGLAFVGAVDPLRGWERLLAGLSHLAREAPAGILMANTSGLLGGAGRRLKAAKLRTLQADLIVAIGSDPALEAVLGDHLALPILRLGTSPLARRKSAGERRAIRQAAFSLHFTGATAWTVEPDELWVEEACAAGLQSDRLLVGMAGADGWDLALGVLACNLPAGAVTVITPIKRALVAGLRCGLLTLDPEFRDRPLAR